MKRKLLAFSMTMALLLSVFSVANVGAHTVTVEINNPQLPTPSRTDWFGVQPDTGQGAIMRNKAQQGEFVFNDATKTDHRLISTPVVTRAADLDWFSVTADPTNIYFFAKVERYNGITQSPSIELMITIDTDQVSVTNNAVKTQLPITPAPVAQTNVPSDAAWEYAVDTTFSPGPGGNAPPYVSGTTKIWSNGTGTQISTDCGGTCGLSQLASAAVNQGSFVELAIPWTLFAGAGIKPTLGSANFLRFTVATMYANHVIPSDGFNSPVIDVLGIGKTLDDIQDGTMASTDAFDVHFDTNPAPINATYEPYAPLLVTEFQPNPVDTDSPGPTNQSKDSEWIEIYNPNSFAINLTNYKIGNAAKRGSGQGMFRFTSGAIASKDTVIVAKYKQRFLDGRPSVPSSKVFDITELSQYSAWATGNTIALANSPDPGQTTFEEQVLLLDVKDDIVDLVNYGNSVSPTPGNIPIVTAAVPEAVSYERCPAGIDTNGGFDPHNPAASNSDFIVRSTPADQTPGTACPGRPGVDMEMVKTASITNGNAGDTVVFSLSYSNVGTDNDPGFTAVVTDTLPAGLTFVSASSLPATHTGQNLSWNVAAPNAGGLPTVIQVTATIDAGLGENVPLVNTAGITSPTEPTDAARRSNNVGQATVTTNGPALLSLNFSGLGRNSAPSSQFTFALDYRNSGQEDATDTIITLNIPANVTLLSADASDASANFTTPILGPTSLTWSVSNVAANTTGTILLTGQVASGAVEGSTLTFSAQAASDAANPKTVPAGGTNTQTVAFNRIYLPMVVR